MSTAAKLSAYGVALVLVAGAAWAVGSAVGPLRAGSAQGGHGGTHGGEDAGHGDDHGATAAGAEQDQPAGLASSRGGYTLTPTDPTPAAGTPFTFRISDREGRAVTAFDVEHDKRMHLVVVRRDTAGYRHVHPEMSPDGTWSVPLDLTDAGTYRVFADFTPTGGPAVTLGADVSVAGAFEPRTYTPSQVAEVDGYRVVLAGDLVPGKASPLTLTVTRGGSPVTDLQPHLAAYGHLVALRQADLAYLHVHPEGSPDDGRTAPGPQISFVAEVPSAGTYRLFLDFRHAGAVRTAEFTAEAGRGH